LLNHSALTFYTDNRQTGEIRRADKADPVLQGIVRGLVYQAWFRNLCKLLFLPLRTAKNAQRTGLAGW